MTDAKYTGSVKCLAIERQTAPQGKSIIHPRTGEKVKTLEAPDFFNHISENSSMAVLQKIFCDKRPRDHSQRITIFYTGEINYPKLKAI